jgi:O-antigen/teichoic acid export membrane protein
MSVATASQFERAPPAEPRVDTLADTVVLMLALTVVQRLVGFVRGVLFCRWLDPEQLGEWDLAFGFLLLAAPLAVLGLPGSFSRYTEYYRSRGQLRLFLRHTATLTCWLTLLAVAAIGWQAAWFSELVFGRGDRIEMVRLLAASLSVVIAYNSLVELFTSLRLFRLISLLQFLHSLLFALVGCGLLWWWRSMAESVVLAYAAACLACGALSVVWLRRTWRSLPEVNQPLARRSLLVKLMPFAVWVWVTNWLSNLFDIVDRYMIVHFSGLEAAEALVQVGNYHSSRVVPILLVSIAGMLGSVALPHLSHDWEAGRRQRVSHSVNLMLKLVTSAVMLAGTAILAAAPWLFGWAFEGKYAGGLAVLPLTLTYCVWFGVIGIAQNYLWCAERARVGSLAVLAGVVTNVLLNLLLLPHYGLHGAVAATAVANFVALALTCLFSQRAGMTFDRGTWLAMLLPPLFVLGPAMCTAALAVFALLMLRGDLVLTREDRTQLAAAWRQWMGKTRGWGLGIRN